MTKHVVRYVHEPPLAGLPEFGGSAGRHYYYCSCGLCGPQRRTADAAKADGTAHLEAAAKPRPRSEPKQ